MLLAVLLVVVALGGPLHHLWRGVTVTRVTRVVVTGATGPRTVESPRWWRLVAAGFK